MKYKTSVLTVFLLALIPALAYAEQEVIPIEEQPCKFTSYIDRTVRQYSERVQIFGFVHPNCETHDLWNEYKVNVKIVNAVTGELVEDGWKPEACLNVDEKQKPRLYEWNTIIQEVGVRLADDKQNGKNHKIFPNHYYTELPMQLNKVHFEPFVVYSVVATYGDMTVSNNFIIVE